MAIVDYNILVAEHLDRLVHDVKEAIKNGWEPQGGITIERYEYTNRGEKEVTTYYHQVVVKHGPDETVVDIPGGNNGH